MDYEYLIDCYWSMHKASAESEMYKRPLSEEACVLLLIYGALDRIDDKLDDLNDKLDNLNDRR